MKPFSWISARTAAAASESLGTDAAKARPIGGGIDLLGEMKEGTIAPERLVNLRAIDGLDRIESEKGGWRIGATVTLGRLAAEAALAKALPVITQAAESVATPQIRNVGTVGGNLCQRPRCWYYRHEAYDCRKKGGTDCFAAEGENKYHAIFATAKGAPCVCVHASDLAPALLACGASVTVEGPGGPREVPLTGFFALPEKDVTRENILAPNEIVTHVHVPAPAAGARSLYLKFRERVSFDFALVSLAAVGVRDAGKWTSLTLVAGGVAPVPWRLDAAEKTLIGTAGAESDARSAAQAALAGAAPLAQNTYKKTLLRNAIVRAMRMMGG